MGDLAEHHLENIPLLTIDLITSSDRLVPQLEIDLSIEISRRLRELGVNLYFNRRVTKEEVDEVYMKDMSIKTKTVIWAAGVEGNELYTKVGLSVNTKKQVAVFIFNPSIPKSFNCVERGWDFVGIMPSLRGGGFLISLHKSNIIKQNGNH